MAAKVHSQGHRSAGVDPASRGQSGAGAAPGRPAARKSLTLQQTVAVVRVSVLALVGLAAAGFFLLLLQERAALVERTRRLMEAALPGLEQAVWNLDDRAADGMLTSLLGIADIRSVRIETQDGAVFSRATRADVADGGWIGWFGQPLFGDLLHRSEPVLHQAEWPPGRAAEQIGTVTLHLDAAVVTRRFLAIVLYQGLQLLVGSLVLATAIAVVVHRLVTRPLTQLGGSITRVDPEDPDRTVLSVAPDHADNELGRLVGSTNDLLRRLGLALDAMRAMASTDDLTGLPNRAALIQAVTEAVRRAAAAGTRFGVLFLDLDDFKQVNDSFGHEVGDQILKAVAERMQSALTDSCGDDCGDGCLVGRLGGDEFVVLVDPLVSTDSVTNAAQAILTAVTRRIETAGHTFRISGSVGIALFPEHGTSFSALFRAADTAMYATKAERRGSWRFFSAEMTEKALARLRLEASLRDALEHEAFELYYQPQVDAASSRLVGCESLLRWRAAGEQIPPTHFIPVAEATHLIIPIGAWVFRAAGQQAKHWTARGLDGRISVNVSPVQLERADQLLETLDRLVRGGDLHPPLLEIEVTESVFMDKVEERAALLDRLRTMGFTIGLDDFGTGYSSLAQLQALPIDTLKVDQAFTRSIPADPRIANVVLALSNQLALRSVAEGIESEAQALWLREHGCRVLQGFLFAPPLCVAAFETRCLSGTGATGEGAGMCANFGGSRLG